MRTLILEGKQSGVPVTVFSTPEELGQGLAANILAGVSSAGAEGRRFLLGCPGGRSLLSTYAALDEQARRSEADLSNLVIVMMDNFVLPADGSFVDCPDGSHYSLRGFAWREIWARLNRGLPETRQIPREHVWFPDPADPRAYDERLRQNGGIDLFLVASGATDGHVAFNPQGSQLEEGTRIIQLADTTRQDNMATFPDFTDLNEVAKYGVSVGLGTIAGLSRSVELVIHGAHKAEAVRRLAGHSDFAPDWPASFIFRCNEPRVLLDEAAAAGLTRATTLEETHG